ncbi:MAG: bifunctional oligoribonuclease/PAP phosphatase NrnA [Marinilabiliales bacterium]
MQLGENEIINKIANIIVSPKSDICVLSHIDPDGDTIGSGLALYLMLKKSGHNVQIIVPNNIPDFLTWLPGCNEYIVATKNKSKAKEILQNSEFIFCIDFNHVDRTGFLKDILLNSKASKILIDHHPDPAIISDIIYSKTEASSTAELVFNIFNKSPLKEKIDADIAENLYVGIMTDTGSFNWAMNTPESYFFVGELLKYNLNQDKIHSLIYHNYSYNRQRLMGYALYEKLKYIPEYNTAYISLTREELKRFKHKKGDTESFVNLPLQIKNVVFTALFIEKDNHVKISFRSKYPVEANKFAEKYFDGGGHKNAAGGSQYNLSMKDTLKKFESLLPDFFNKIIK